MVRSDAGTVVQLNGYSDLKCLALAVTSDGNINQLGDGDDGDLSVQDDAEKIVVDFIEIWEQSGPSG